DHGATTIFTRRTRRHARMVGGEVRETPRKGLRSTASWEGAPAVPSHFAVLAREDATARWPSTDIRVPNLAWPAVVMCLEGGEPELLNSRLPGRPRGHSVVFVTAEQSLLDLATQDSARALDRRLRHYGT